MRRDALTLPPARLLAVALACGVAGCGLEVAGLETPDAASVPTSTSVSDASVSPVDHADAAAPGSDAPGSAASIDAATSPADAPISPPLPDSDVPDVIFADGTTPAPDGGDPCDLDQDGFRGADHGCGGVDCCDTDGRAHPGQLGFFTTADACGSFDYNCDGLESPQFGRVFCTLALLACNGSGFDQSPPACGATATFDACNLGLGCYTAQSQQAQSCH